MPSYPPLKERLVFAVNAGSSSLKFALFAEAMPPTRLLGGKVERIGLAGTSLSWRDRSGQNRQTSLQAATHRDALTQLRDQLQADLDLQSLAAVGHRVVHGGPHYHQAQAVTPEMLAELRRISPCDPEHLPAEIALIEAFLQLRPGLPQIACFDTGFHHDLPAAARILPIPRRYAAQGIRRYGFHGLSYAYLMQELERLAGPQAAQGRVILAHLGNGASMAAVLGGRSRDTTMGFTPTAGLPMSTRSGDLDPGLVAYLARSEGMTADQFHELVNRRSGLLGVSEISPDIRDLLAKEAGDARAAEAIELFCYQGRKCIGAYAAALGGLDTLVFSAGIGENRPEIRARICSGLDFLGIRLDDDANLANLGIISQSSQPVTVRVIPTDEELMIANDVLRITGR